jgi:thioredoxin-related protein
MGKLITLLLCLPFALYAQEERGVKFEQGLSWREIKEKARVEKKYIFVDCYTTWCGPCKAMDKNVYINDTVGDYMKGSFISIKVQMDTSKNDNDEVRRWYADAHAFQQTFKVNAYPSFLFFSPDGNLVHRDIGYKSVNGFVDLAQSAVDSTKQYYTQLENYKKGNRKYAKMAWLINKTLVYENKSTADMMAKDYKENYLDSLKVMALATKENLDFIRQYPTLIGGSMDPFFSLFYNHPKLVDSISRYNGFADKFVKYIIRNDVLAKLYSNNKPITNKPDWNTLEKYIKTKYSGNYARQLLPEIQLGFYQKINNWREYARLFEKQLKNTPPQRGGKSLNEWGDAWALNNEAWIVFFNCDDKDILRKALNWSRLSVELEEKPGVIFQYYDTQANLLYKLGNVREAIAMEEKAIALDDAYGKKLGKEKGVFLYQFSAILEKMKKGEPTWNE